MIGPKSQGIIVFINICTILILLLVMFITVIIYRYQQKQNVYFKTLEELKIIHENEMLYSRLEIQEQTFQNISREIHDNIGQKLSLAKLHLNTLDISDQPKAILLINDSVNMISESIIDLSDISRSMSSEIILNNGLIKALEFEKGQLEKSGIYTIDLNVSGDTVFLEANKELLLFRIAQEALNNIIKHAGANAIVIRLHYHQNRLNFEVSDNGCGFVTNQINKEQSAGLINMAKRARMLQGNCSVISFPNTGTTIKIDIPLNNDHAYL